MIREKLAARLRLFREAAGLTIYEVGEKVGKSGKTVSAWENGRGQPDADMLLTLCDIYGIQSISELYGMSPVDSLSPEETKILNLYRSFNDEGKEQLVKYADYLDSQPEYKKCSSAAVASKEA